MLDEIGPQTFENDPDFWGTAFPVPRIDGHKYARGHVLAVSGDAAATGAARLAARGALRAGAGLVTLASPRDALAINASALTAVMVRPVDTAVEFAELLGDKRYNTCMIGPGAGVGERTCDLCPHRASRRSGICVLDADALTSFAANPERLFESIMSSHDNEVVLTPHEGEFPRLFSDLSNKHPGRSKLERVRAAAERSGAVVLLKGPDTTIAAPDGRATIAANAPPWLATAGAGDVLSGIIAGLLAQGVPAFEAASIGVWMHGEAASEAGPGLIAEDLTETLPAVHRRIYDALGSSTSTLARALRAGQRSVPTGCLPTSGGGHGARSAFVPLPLAERRALTPPRTSAPGAARPSRSRRISISQRPGEVRDECDAVGLAGLDRERVEPIGLPAVVEVIEQAEMVAVQVEDGRHRGRVLQGQHDGAAGLGAEGRSEAAEKLAGRVQLASVRPARHRTAGRP